MANATPPPPRVEPRLLATLAETGDASVEVVVTLRVSQSGSWDRERVQATAAQLLDAAEAASNTQPERVNILANIGAIILRAPAPFIHAMTRSPLVATIALK